MKIREEKSRGILLPCCSICNEVPDGGIAGGFRIKKGFICKNCERLIISLDISSPAYHDVMQKLRIILK